jgi:hypothetical protein
MEPAGLPEETTGMMDFTYKVAVAHENSKRQNTMRGRELLGRGEGALPIFMVAREALLKYRLVLQ